MTTKRSDLVTLTFQPTYEPSTSRVELTPDGAPHRVSSKGQVVIGRREIDLYPGDSLAIVRVDGESKLRVVKFEHDAIHQLARAYDLLVSIASGLSSNMRPSDAIVVTRAAAKLVKLRKMLEEDDENAFTCSLNGEKECS